MLVLTFEDNEDDMMNHILSLINTKEEVIQMQALSEMTDDDKLSIQAYLESKGAWTTEIGNQDSREYGEYHLDVRYNTDTDELIDMEERKVVYDKAMEPINADEETNLICIFQSDSRTKVIKDIHKAVGHIDDDDLAELSVRVVQKLEKMSDEMFAGIDLEFAE